MGDRGWYPALTVLAALAVLTGVAVVVSVVGAASADAKANNKDGNTCQESSEAGLMSVTKDGPLVLYHYATAESTQDEARAIVSLPRDEFLLMIPPHVANSDDDDSDFNMNTVVVTASEQTKGRGTNGRDWMGARGNTFVTICIPQKSWSATSLSVTLLPIQIGIVMAQQVSKALDACKAQINGRPASSKVTIKWPNDVLVKEQKIAGVLIESTTEWFLIGIGVNVAHAPSVPQSGPNHGRPATCIQCHCPKDNDSSAPKPQEWVDLARELGVAMAANLSQWLARCVKDKDTAWNAHDEQTHMLQQWRSFVDWDMQLVLRDSTDKEQSVLPIDIEPDGRLRVQSITNGQERLVVSDYFL